MELSDATEVQPLLKALTKGEQIHALVRAREGYLVVTDRRVALAATDRLALDVPYECLRRIEFDIERSRPATLVVVPDRPTDSPQVLAVPVDEYAAATVALFLIGQRIATIG